MGAGPGGPQPPAARPWGPGGLQPPPALRLGIGFGNIDQEDDCPDHEFAAKSQVSNIFYKYQQLLYNITVIVHYLIKCRSFCTLFSAFGTMCGQYCTQIPVYNTVHFVVQDSTISFSAMEKVDTKYMLHRWRTPRHLIVIRWKFSSGTAVVSTVPSYVFFWTF